VLENVNVADAGLAEPQKAQHVEGEKFSQHHDDDFQEWEQYDVIHMVDPGPNATISKKFVPEYIRGDLEAGSKFQSISYEFISEVKCGIKLGRRFSDVDAKWAEKWYEIRCKDVSVAKGKKKVTDVIVKFVSKFWTKAALIEGESRLQILADGSKTYVHDGLLFELQDVY